MITFKKKIASKNNFHHYINTVVYEVFNDDSLISILEIKNGLVAKFSYDESEYHIKPIVKFFIISKFEILLKENDKIGEIKYWGWNCKKPKITINSIEGKQIWIFNKNPAPFLKKRKDTYETFLDFNETSISYKISKGVFFSRTKNDSLRESFGTIHNFETNPLVGLVGLFLNELLIFDEMDK